MAYPCAAGAAEAGNGFRGAIEQIALVGSEARQIGIAGAIGAEPGAAGLARQVQGLHANPPHGGLGPGLDKGQALPTRLEETQVAVAFERDRKSARLNSSH